MRYYSPLYYNRRMDILPRRKLLEYAPAAASPKGRRLDADRLLDTAEWLKKASQYGFEPVFALQGSTHSDAGQVPEDGRHLIVTADPDGRAWTLLNSHDRLMRVWYGVGRWHGGELLLKRQMAARRWHPVLPPSVDVDEIADVAVARAGASWTRDIAADIAKDGYISGRGRPSSTALEEAARNRVTEPFSRLDFAAACVAAARKGNLAPSTHAKTRRNVKGVRRPDAYQVLALAAWKAAVGV